jgi:prevent-host-death family protein
MSTQVNIHEAKTHLSRLVQRAAAGEEIVIAKAGAPLAKLVRYSPSSEPRQLGFLRGRVRILPGFDEMDEEIQALFEDGD